MRIRQTVETSSRLPRPPALAIMSSATLLGAASILEAAETAPRARLRDGNDDPSCHEADKPDSPATAVRSAFNRLDMVFVQASIRAGTLQLEALSDGLESAKAAIQSNAPELRPVVD